MLGLLFSWRGTMAHIAMAVSGRPARVDALTGPGASAVARWLS